LKQRRKLSYPKKRGWGLVVLSLSLLAAMSLGMKVSGQAQPANQADLSPPVSAAYVYDRAGLVLRDEDAPYLNQLNYAFALIDQGRVVGDHWQGIKAFETYVKRHPHILPVMAIGGWGADGFSQAAATAEGRQRFVESALILMEKHGFLGLDLDWEYPGSSAAGIASDPADGENLILLLETLRQGLEEMSKQDGQKRYLTIALGALPEHTQGIDLNRLGSLVDQVNLMTYDLKGFDKTTGHHAALYPSKGTSEQLSGHGAVQYYVEQGIPVEKIMLGAAFYGRCWRQVQGGGDGFGQRAVTSGNKTYTFDEIRQMVEQQTFESYWDEEARAPYLFDGSSFISYEDEASCREKGLYAQQNDLMGTVAWQYGQDTSGSLIKALHDGLNSP